MVLYYWNQTASAFLLETCRDYVGAVDKHSRDEGPWDMDEGTRTEEADSGLKQQPPVLLQQLQPQRPWDDEEVVAFPYLDDHKDAYRDVDEDSTETPFVVAVVELSWSCRLPRSSP